MDLEKTLMELIHQQPGQTTTQLHQALGGAGLTRPSRAKLSALLRGMPEVADDGADPLRWYPTHTLAQATRAAPPARVDRSTASSRPPTPATTAKAATDTKPKSTRKTKETDDELRQLSKRQLITIICHEIGVPDVGIGRGSTEPKELFLRVSAALGLGLDPTLSKPALGEAISQQMGLSWDPDMDSRTTVSGGGDTVTARGLRQVLRAVRAAGSPTAPLDPPAVSENVVEGHAPEPAALYGLQQAPPQPGNSTGQGGGGEGPLHAALKALIKDHPLEAIGEQLTYLAEDLTDIPTQRLGDEIKFITGDRVDLLMQDEAGRMVVIEVEPDIGRADHIGFHQAAKYWVLVAVANGLELGNVRRVVAARTIDAGLASHYLDSYGIESVAVPMTETLDGWVLAPPSIRPPPSPGPPPSRSLPGQVPPEARAAPGAAVVSERMEMLMREWELRHGKLRHARNISFVEAALAELGGYSEDVVLEAIASVSRPHDLKATAEAVSLRRARAATGTRAAAPRRAPTKRTRSVRTTLTNATTRTKRVLKATGAAMGEAPLYKSLPPGQRYCPGCGLLEINCHCG